MMKIKHAIISIIFSTALFSTNLYAEKESLSSNRLGIKEASWYGPGFHGRKTASGERFNQYAMTAAHKKLPFGTKVRVTCVATGKSAVVVINDRGPFHGNRAIDLSKGAAQAIGMLDKGTAKVILERLN